jgi:hypothetical protein
LYGSKNDVAVLVNGLVRDIVKALGLAIQMFMKICAFGLHPEVWVVAWNMISIGVIVVKKWMTMRKALARVFWISLLSFGSCMTFK